MTCMGSIPEVILGRAVETMVRSRAVRKTDVHMPTNNTTSLEPDNVCLGLLLSLCSAGCGGDFVLPFSISKLSFVALSSLVTGLTYITNG